MTRNLAWARAYRQQAAADLAALELLSRCEAAPGSVLAMLLQMALEKAMKAAMLGIHSSSSPEALAGGHQMFQRVVQSAMLQRAAPISRVVLSDRWKTRALANRDPLYSFLARLDASSPSAVARRTQVEGTSRLAAPCLEYPWENAPRRACFWPERHHDLCRELRSPLRSPLMNALHYLRRVVKELGLVLPEEESWS